MFPHTTIKQKNIKKSACYTTDKVEILYLFLSFFSCFEQLYKIEKGDA